MTHVRNKDSEAFAGRRRLADTFGLPAECPHDICQRAGRCRGPRGASAAFPGEALPDCLATGFESLYAPVARWDRLMDAIDRAEKRLPEGVSGSARE